MTRLPRVTAKLGRQRKPQEYLVSPTSDGRILVQSDKAIGIFDFRSRKGTLNIRGCYFPHLNEALGAERYDFPVEFVRDCMEVCPALDSETRIGGVVIHNTVQVF